MAPSKFGLFKARSRDHQEQPSTENLLQSENGQNNDRAPTPDSPIPSTSKGITVDTAFAELSMLSLDSDDEYSPQPESPVRRLSDCSKIEECELNYQILNNPSSPDATTTSTLDCEDPSELATDFDDNASTTYDANSIRFDDASIADSESVSVYCGTLKKKKDRLKDEQLLRDLNMWRASNFEVMQNILSKSGTLDEQIKWEAIATARGLCTLTDNCTCGDCTRAKFLVGMADGDGGLGAAPIFNAINLGCQLQ